MAVTASNATGPGEGWHAWIARLLPTVVLTPLRITAIYAVFGVSALYVSDVLFVRYLSEPILSQVQALKGGIEVLLTAGLIFALTARSENRLRDANARLEQQRDELQLLHRVLRHNLRNDLTIVQGYADLIRDAVAEEETERRCERLLKTAEEMERYTEQAQRIRKASEAKNRENAVDLGEVIPAVLADNSRVTSGVEVTTAIPDGAEVSANPMIDEAIDELVTNAVRHNDADAPAITIEALPESGPDGMTTIRIIDDGPGVPESEMAALRDDDREPLRHLSGMGLWFVDWVVTHSGGEFQVSNAENGGTEVLVHLPSAGDSSAGTDGRRFLPGTDAIP